METIEVRAIEHRAADESVVHSGLNFAEAVLNAINSGARVRASLRGLKGASSSYFNVFLRRIDEACGLASFDDQVEMEFDSRVQEMMYRRSLDSLKRGTKQPPTFAEDLPGLNPDSSPSWWHRLKGLVFSEKP